MMTTSINSFAAFEAKAPNTPAAPTGDAKKTQDAASRNSLLIADPLQGTTAENSQWDELPIDESKTDNAMLRSAVLRKTAASLEITRELTDTQSNAPTAIGQGKQIPAARHADDSVAEVSPKAHDDSGTDRLSTNENTQDFSTQPGASASPEPGSGLPWSAVLSLLLGLSADLRKANYTAVYRSMDRQEELLTMMGSNMDTSRIDTKSATEMQCAWDIAFNTLQLCGQAATLYKQAKLTGDNKELSDLKESLPEETKQLAAATEESKENAANVAALANDAKGSATGTDPTSKVTLDAASLKANQAVNEADTAAKLSGEVNDVTNSKAFRKTIDEKLQDNEEWSKRYHYLHQMAPTATGIGHAIGGLLAAGDTAGAQEAQKNKELMDGKMQLEAGARSLSVSSSEFWSQDLAGLNNAITAGATTEAESAKSAARAA